MTADEITALKNKISDAETKYHALMTGTMARVIVDQNGERVEFTTVKRADLYSYIQQLKSLLPDDFPVQVARPIRFLF